MASEDSLVLLAGGDVTPGGQPDLSQADLVMPALDEADFRFLQCERTFSHRGTFPDWLTIPKGKWSRLPPESAAIFQRVNADVVSLAGNHSLDWGYEPLEDTINLFREWGMQPVGAGKNEAEARRPAIIEKDGIKVAILAYCSVIREGQAAVADHMGVAAIRARTWYLPVDFHPGCPPLIMSEALDEDIAAMQEDIRAAKQIANAVVVSMHWGIRAIPKTLAKYQRPVAHAAIDAGADVIIGHHAHSVKAIEVYKGRTCFYSTGNFLTNGRTPQSGHGAPGPFSEWDLFYWEKVDPASLYQLPIHCHYMLLPKISFTRDGIGRVAVVPGYFNKLAQPRMLRSDEELFQSSIDWLEFVSHEVPHEFEVDGDEIVVSSPK